MEQSHQPVLPQDSAQIPHSLHCELCLSVQLNFENTEPTFQETYFIPFSMIIICVQSLSTLQIFKLGEGGKV